jgi:uncharacterized protein YpiB (UPF0302 family)
MIYLFTEKNTTIYDDYIYHYFYHDGGFKVVRLYPDNVSRMYDLRFNENNNLEMELGFIYETTLPEKLIILENNNTFIDEELHNLLHEYKILRTIEKV